MKTLAYVFLPLFLVACAGSSDHDEASTNQHLSAAPASAITPTDKMAAQVMMQVVLDKKLLPPADGLRDDSALVKLAIDGRSADSAATISSLSCSDANGLRACVVGFGVTPKNPTGPVLVSGFSLEIDLQGSVISHANLTLFAG